MDRRGRTHKVEVLLRQQAFKPKTNGAKAASSRRQHSMHPCGRS